MAFSSRLRASRLAAAAATVLGLAGLAGSAAAVDIDFAATAARSAAPASASVGGNAAVDLNPALAAKDQEDYARYVQWQRDYARRGWEWHLFSTQFLFGMVMAIVAFGLWLTHKQFQRDYVQQVAAPTADGSTAPPPPAQPAPAPSSLKLGPAGLELTSQVVGLLVLAVSVAFFYFYVKEVYPMREVERDTSAVTSPPAK
jgi:hypothetical protein